MLIHRRFGAARTEWTTRGATKGPGRFNLLSSQVSILSRISNLEVLPGKKAYSRFFYCVAIWLIWMATLGGISLLVSQDYAPSDYPLRGKNFAALRAATASSARFGVIGDFGIAGQPEQDVANLVKSWNPDFIVTVGDNNYDFGEAATIDQNIGQYYHDYIFPYTGSYGAGATTNRFFPTLGNHDWDSSDSNQPYLAYFTLPGNERYYDFVQGPVHFFMLDSDGREPDGVTSVSIQASWLQAKLAAATEPWKLVIFHQAAYTSGTVDGPTPYMRWPFKTWGASAVLSGHEHGYERLVSNGLPYFVDGAGGQTLYSFGIPAPESQVRYSSDYGAMLVDASATSITFKFINRAGSVIDTYTLNTSLTIPVAPSSLSVTPASTTQVNLKWSDNSGNEDNFQLERKTGAGGSWGVVTSSIAANQTTYSDTGLTPGTVYYYRLVAFNAAGNSAYSNEFNITTPSVPATPSNLTGTPVSTTQLNLSWTDNAGNETGFRLERRIGTGGSWTLVSNTIAANQTSYSDSGLTPGTQYYYRLLAFNTWGNSAYSNLTNTTTPTLPVAPSGLSATVNSNTEIALSWADNSTGETGFRLERKSGVNGTWTPVSNNIAANQTGYTDSGLVPGTQYYYRIQALNQWGGSAYSNEANATSTAFPATPSNLNAIPATNTLVNLGWTDNANNENGFRLERKIGANGGWVVRAATITANQTSYQDSGLIPGLTYYYRLQSFNSWGNSDYSNEDSATTSVDFVVTNEADDGNQTYGTLSYALANASSGQQITFALPNGKNTINVTQALPEVPQGVKILASCNSGPTIIIDGSGVAGDGLVLNGGVTLNGIAVKHFGGTQIRFKGPDNRLTCVSSNRKPPSS